jgi:uncharacterized protein
LQAPTSRYVGCIAEASMRKLLALLVTVLFAWMLSGCGGHSERTAPVRSALDRGNIRAALDALNRELRVSSDSELPAKLVSDDALLVLDRASVQQSAAQHHFSKRDFQAADKALEVLDLSRGSADDMGRWLFSDSAGRYVAPSHEKLLVNVLNMVNYLETGDLSGARVEARRLAVTSRYLRDRGEPPNAALGLGALLAGFAYERSGHYEEAARYYREAGHLRTARLAELEADQGEVLIVVGYGRVPHRVANRVPIGMAMTRAAMHLDASDRETAGKLAKQGLVTWINYPSLAPHGEISVLPEVGVSGRPVQVEPALDVTRLVRDEWGKIEGKVMAAAVTRAVGRALVGGAIEGATSASDSDELKAIGLIASFFIQIAMTAADTPDTRSWETLPARVAVARVVVPAGDHRVRVHARGMIREGTVRVAPRGHAVVSLMALR